MLCFCQVEGITSKLFGYSFFSVLRIIREFSDISVCRRAVKCEAGAAFNLHIKHLAAQL
jgi:hypothetical protein